MYCVFTEFIYTGEIEAFGIFQSPRSIFIFAHFDFVCNYQLHLENSKAACSPVEVHHKKMQLSPRRDHVA